jgi:Kdo2-lipid IVA lauroyltransferase/acyltransferase
MTSPRGVIIVSAMPDHPPIGKRARFALESALAATLLAAARVLPRRILLAIGAAAGSLAYTLDRKHTRVALENLEAAFGATMPPGERREVVRACWRHYGRITADAAAFHRLSIEDVGRRVRYEGLDVVRDAYAQGKGVLVISGHFGHWELTAYMQGLIGCPMLMITRSMENPRLERMLAAVRGGSGNPICPKERAVRELVKALARGIGVAVMIDQDARGAGIFVPFFGRPASTIPTVGMMHLRTGAPVVATFSYPEPGGRWRIVYEPVSFAGLTGDRDADVRAITAQTTALLERRVRERPELWLWMHRRWKTPPRDAA